MYANCQRTANRRSYEYLVSADSRLHYTIGKNLKTGSLKVLAWAIAIITRYQQDRPKQDLIFLELKVLEDMSDTYNVQRKISFAVNRLNTALAKIAERTNLQKPLTMYGNFRRKDIRADASKPYHHSNITTIIGYQSNFINKTADNTLDT